ncbi:MAG: L,D-transpeptidase [Thermodesulfobacteriota bacterium]
MRMALGGIAWRRFLGLVAAVLVVAGGSTRPAMAGAGGDQFCVTEIAGLTRPAVEDDLLRIPYAMVTGSQEVPVYGAPGDDGRGKAPLRHLPAGYVGVSLENPEPLVVDGQGWYQINHGEYVRAEALEPVIPSSHQGIMVPPGMDRMFAWVLFSSKVSSAPGALTEEDALVLPERSLVYIYEMEEANGEKWYHIGCGGWLPYRRLGLVIPRQRPEGVGPAERWLDVSLNEQTLVAYEGNRMFFATLISAGNSRFPTVQGLFRIYFKAQRKKMSGGVAGDDLYFLEDVLWQMYFHQGYALHASYWHDLFGLTTSHGCINLSPRDAQWLFQWTTATKPAPRRKQGGGGQEVAGTLIWVHE